MKTLAICLRGPRSRFSEQLNALRRCYWLPSLIFQNTLNDDGTPFSAVEIELRPLRNSVLTDAEGNSPSSVLGLVTDQSYSGWGGLRGRMVRQAEFQLHKYLA
jgi:hypothetical protein